MVATLPQRLKLLKLPCIALVLRGTPEEAQASVLEMLTVILLAPSIQARGLEDPILRALEASLEPLRYVIEAHDDEAVKRDGDMIMYDLRTVQDLVEKIREEVRRKRLIGSDKPSSSGEGFTWGASTNAQAYAKVLLPVDGGRPLVSTLACNAFGEYCNSPCFGENTTDLDCSSISYPGKALPRRTSSNKPSSC